MYLFIYLLASPTLVGQRLCFDPCVFIYWFVCMYVCLYVCDQLFSETSGPNYMRFSGMIRRHPRTNRLDFVSDQVKGQGPGHEKVKNVFVS